MEGKQWNCLCKRRLNKGRHIWWPYIRGKYKKRTPFSLKCLFYICHVCLIRMHLLIQQDFTLSSRLSHAIPPFLRFCLPLVCSSSLALLFSRFTSSFSYSSLHFSPRPPSPDSFSLPLAYSLLSNVCWTFSIFCYLPSKRNQWNICVFCVQLCFQLE